MRVCRCAMFKDDAAVGGARVAEHDTGMFVDVMLFRKNPSGMLRFLKDIRGFLDDRKEHEFTKHDATLCVHELIVVVTDSENIVGFIHTGEEYADENYSPVRVFEW